MRRACYIFIVLFTLYAAALYDSAALVFLAGAEVFLPLLLFLQLLPGSFLLQLSFVGDSGAWDSGEEKALRLCLRKKGFLPLRLVCFRLCGRNRTTGERHRQWVRVPAERGETMHTVALPELSCGVWEFSMRHIRVYDHMQLFCLPKWGRKWARAVSRVVLPECHPLRIRLTEGKAWKANLDAAGGNRFWEQDRGNRGDLRDYRPGDALNEIHWKLSAKKDALLVWEQERKAEGGWILGLDFDGWSQQRAELVYSLLRALHRDLGRGAVTLMHRPVQGKRDAKASPGLPQSLCIHEEQPPEEAMGQLMGYWPCPCPEEAPGGDDILPFSRGEEHLQEALLTVRQPLALWQGSQLLWDFSELSLKEALQDRELVL